MLLNFFVSLAVFWGPLAADTTHYDLLVGSYTKDGNPGIEVFDVNPATGAAKSKYVIKNANASYLAFSADKNNLYAVTEEGGGRSAITAYQLNARGEYTLLNTTATVGEGPCFVSYREASQTVYTANYNSGSLSVFKTQNGRLLPVAQHIVYAGSSVNKARQEAPHAHNVIVSPDQNYIYVTDLGSDRIYQHKVYADGTVDKNYRAIPVKAGNGPRHLVFDHAGTHAYLMNELSGTVDVFQVTDGQFKLLQSLKADTTASKVKGSADIHLSPSGRWLLTSNRVTCNEVTVFGVQPDGTLKKVRHYPVTKRPRNFSFDPAGKWVFVAGQEDNKVQVFSFNDADGSLSDTQKDIVVKMPVCLLFMKNPQETDPEERIRSLNITLIPPVAPIANYVKFVQVGNLVYLSGHGPDKPGGGQVYGQLGKNLTVEEGQAAARLTGISLISTLKGYIGDLNKVKRVVKVLGLVSCDPSFTQQPQVMNGFSNLMVEIFGDRGRHARSSVGVASLPNNIPVEIEMIIELK